MRIATLLFVLAGVPAAWAQEPARLPHTSMDPAKCKTCAPALEKAYGFLEKNKQADGYRQIFMGFVWLADGNRPENLKRSIDVVSGGFYKGNGQFNANWATCMSAIFLSEVYKRHPTDEIRETLIDLLKVAETNMEATGGWCHHLGFAAESGYNKKGGGVDLGILTCMMFGAMLNMKSSGIEVNPRLIQKVQENLEKLSDGPGVCYGTDNKVGDTAMGRASWAWLGICAANYTATKLARGIPQGLKTRYKQTDQGHAYPPVHFAGVAMAMHLMGPEMYNKFALQWIDRLISLQKEDGSVELPHSEGKEFQKQDGYLGGTATFALILLLQQPGAFDKHLAREKKGQGGGIYSGTSKPATPASVKGRPYLGLRGGTFADSVDVTGVEAEGPAQEAGLFATDLIIEFRGRKIGRREDLRSELAKCSPGQKVPVVFLRGAERKTLTVKLGTTEKEGEGEVF